MSEKVQLILFDVLITGLYSYSYFGICAVGSISLRNKQNSGGQRTKQEYMNSTMCRWLISLVLALGMLMQATCKQPVNNMVLKS